VAKPLPEIQAFEVEGYIRRGPDFQAGFEGWRVYAHEVPGQIDIPVTIRSGHGPPPKKKRGGK